MKAQAASVFKKMALTKADTESTRRKAWRCCITKAEALTARIPSGVTTPITTRTISRNRRERSIAERLALVALKPDTRRNLVQRADVVVVAVLAKREGVEVQGRDPGRSGAADVGEDRVADMNCLVGTDSGSREGRFEDSRIGFRYADHGRVDDDVDPGPDAVADLDDAFVAEARLDSAVGVGHDRQPDTGGGKFGQRGNGVRDDAAPTPGSREEGA